MPRHGTTGRQLAVAGLVAMATAPSPAWRSVDGSRPRVVAAAAVFFSHSYLHYAMSTDVVDQTSTADEISAFLDQLSTAA